MPQLFDDQDDNEQEVKSSAASDTLDDAADEHSDAAAGSSAANDDEAEKSTVDIVRDVVKAEGDAADTASSAEGDEAAGQDDGGSASQEQDGDEFKDVPFHKHPRFQQLVTERNSYKVDAERHHNVQNFLDSNGLTSEEAADALVIFAQAKVDPVKAWAAVKPWVQNLLIAAGEVLPDDLRGRVENGELTLDAANEISRARAQSSSAERRQTFADQQRERNDAKALSTSLVNTANKWEADRKRLDPNFAAKQLPLRKEIAYLHSVEGIPNTPEGVQDQLKRAYKAVNDSFKAPPASPKPNAASQQQQPARRPAIKPVMGGQHSGSASDAPKTTLDIIRANRRAG